MNTCAYVHGCAAAAVVKCMYVRMYVCMYVCVCVYVCTHVCIQMRMCLHACMCASMHACVHINRHEALPTHLSRILVNFCPIDIHVSQIRSPLHSHEECTNCERRYATYHTQCVPRTVALLIQPCFQLFTQQRTKNRKADACTRISYAIF